MDNNNKKYVILNTSLKELNNIKNKSYNILPNNIKEHFITLFLYGSYVYHTNNKNSDKDIIVITNNNIDFSKYPNNIYELRIDNFDFQILTDSTFKNMIYDHHIIALESMYMDPIYFYDYNLFYHNYKNLFILDRWKLRKAISTIVNNFYAKCHKKLIVEKDYDLYRAKKSMFHCLRLYQFGINILTDRWNPHSCSDLYNEVMKEENNSWEILKEKYKPKINELMSEFVKLCPKPISSFKDEIYFRLY